MTATEIVRDTNSGEITLRYARNDEADSERFCALSNSLYARKVDLAYYRWQFFATPFPCVLSVAETPAGELAGCYGVQARRCAKTGRNIGMALDIMIAPAFQGKGLFRRLAAHAVRQAEAFGLSAVFVMANARASEAHTHGLQWRPVTRLADWTLAAEAVPVSPASKMRLTPVTLLGADENAVLGADTKRRGRVGMGLARDAALWQWRFVENPRYRYELLRAEHQGRLAGLLALKLFVNPVTNERFGDIVDIAWREEDFALLPSLLISAANHLREQGAQQISTWLQTNTVLDAVGRSLGFQPTARLRYVLCRVLNDDHAWLEDLSRWCVTMADTDMY